MVRKKSDTLLYGLTVFVLLALMAVGLLYHVSAQPSTDIATMPVENDFKVVITDPMIQFAECLTENGALFYGSYQCPYCNQQREMFGGGSDYVPYVECGALGAMNDRCRQAGIRMLPTWRFSDGTERLGLTSFETLKSKTGC